MALILLENQGRSCWRAATHQYDTSRRRRHQDTKLLKFAILLIALICAVPLSILLQRHPALARLFWISFGALPFLSPIIPFFDMGLILWDYNWAAFVYGLVVSGVDVMAVAAYLTLMNGRSTPLIYKLPFIIYLVAAAVSIIPSYATDASIFGFVQFARMFLIMAVVARASAEEPHIILLILQGMAIGLVAHMIASLYQRLALGHPQASGLFIHQNALGMTTYFVLMPHMALLLAGRRNVLFLVCAIAAAAIVVALTGSRGSVGFAAGGLLLTFVVLAFCGITRRKVVLAIGSFVAVLAIAPVVVSSFEQRFEETPLEEDVYDERAAFEATAELIFADHPFGSGINTYAHLAGDYGYAEKGGVAMVEENLGNIVHNAYLLAAAETGWFGVIAFCLMLFAPLLVALKKGLSVRRTVEGHLMLGFAVALLMVYAHSMLEWILFAKEVQYPLAMTMGMVFGLAQSFDEARKAPASAGYRAA